MGNFSSAAKNSNPAYLIFEDIPLYDPWLKLILSGILALTLIIGVALLYVDRVGAYIFLGVTVFDALLFHIILPRRYQVFKDRLRIVLGHPFSFNVPLSTIREGRSASGLKAFAYWGLRFATSSKSIVEIIRGKGWNIVISPANKEIFLYHLSQALKSA